MKPLLLFLSLLFNTCLTAQLNIRVTITNDQGNLKFESVYTEEGSPLPLETDEAKKKAIKKGGSLTLHLDESIPQLNYQAKKNNTAGSRVDLHSQTGVFRTGNDLIFNFDNAGKLKKHDSLKQNLTNPSLSLENFQIDLFSEHLSKRTLATDTLVPFAMLTATSELPVTPKCDCDEKYSSLKSKGTLVLIYDFECERFFRRKKDGTEEEISIGRLRMKHGQQLRLLIRNVNRYIYDVGISADQYDYDSEVPALLNEFFFSDSSKIFSKLSDAAKESFSVKESEYKSYYEDFNKALSNLLENLNDLKAKRLKAYMKCETFDCCKAKDWETEFKDLLNTLSYLQTTAINLRTQLLAEGSKEEIIENISLNREDYLECRKTIQNFEKLNREANKKIAALREKNDTAGIRKINEEIKNAEKDICKNPDELNSALRKEMDKLATLVGIDSLLKLIPSENAITELFLFSNNIIREHGEFRAPPIPAKGNLIGLTIHIRPNDTSLAKRYATYPLKTDSIGTDIPVIWKPFVSFSSGSYVTFGNTLYNKTYQWQPLPAGNNTVSDSAKFVLAESGYSSPSAGFAALVNLETEFLPGLGFGISGGVGLTIEEKPRLSYLGGGSLFIGGQRQLVLTAGIAAMQINKLANNMQAVFDQGITYTYRPEIQYYKQLKTGGFIALTYTPFKTVKKRVSNSN